MIAETKQLQAKHGEPGELCWPVSSLSGIEAIESRPLNAAELPSSTFDIIEATAGEHGDRPALVYLRTGSSSDVPRVLTYQEFCCQVIRAANLFASIGVGRDDVVSFLLPNLPETHFALWGAQVVGISNPINPFLEPPVIREILSAARTKVLVVLSPAERRDTWQKAVSAIEGLSHLEHVLWVDLDRTDESCAPHELPKDCDATSFSNSLKLQRDELAKEIVRPASDQIAAYFHTGGTTGVPKLAKLRHSNIVYQAYTFKGLLGLTAEDVAMGGLPLFHINAMLTAGVANFAAGSAVLMMSPDGYRSPTVIEDHWQLVEKYRSTWFSGVPTVHTALLGVPLKGADLSSLRFAICGAAPATRELFKRVEETLGIQLIEGYGLTEGSCVSSLQPLLGSRKIGSIGMRLPYQEMRCVQLDEQGNVARDCQTDEVGEIVVRGPNVFAGYSSENADQGVLLADGWLATGDLGREDADGFFWLTGRSKDLIIRGGHNIDPGMIENAISRHPDVETVAAIGQPDAYAGELPVAYVSLRQGSDTNESELLEFTREHIGERAAVPVHLEILKDMPVTAVGKLFKPALRQLATERVVRLALEEADIAAAVDSRLDKLGRVIVSLQSTDPMAIEILKSLPIQIDE